MPYLICMKNRTTGIEQYLLGGGEGSCSWSCDRPEAKRFDSEAEAQKTAAVLPRTDEAMIEVVEETDYHRRSTLG